MLPLEDITKKKRKLLIMLWGYIYKIFGEKCRGIAKVGFYLNIGTI